MQFVLDTWANLYLFCMKLFLRYFEYLFISNIWVALGLALLVVPASYSLAIPVDLRTIILGFFVAFFAYTFDHHRDISRGEWQPSINIRNYYNSTIVELFSIFSILGILIILLISPIIVSISIIILAFVIVAYNCPIVPPFFNQDKTWCRIKDITGIKAWFVSFVCAACAVISPMVFSYYSFESLDLTSAGITFIFFFMMISCNAHMYDIRDMVTDKENDISTLPVMIGETNTIRLLHIMNVVAGIMILFAWILDYYPLHLELLLWNAGTFLYLIYIRNGSRRIVFDFFIDGTLFLPAFYLMLIGCK